MNSLSSHPASPSRPRRVDDISVVARNIPEINSVCLSTMGSQADLIGLIKLAALDGRDGRMQSLDLDAAENEATVSDKRGTPDSRIRSSKRCQQEWQRLAMR